MTDTPDRKIPTYEEVADRLGKSSQSAHVEWIMLSADPEALTVACETGVWTDYTRRLGAEANAAQRKLYEESRDDPRAQAMDDAYERRAELQETQRPGQPGGPDDPAGLHVPRR
jgi:hypothetical protein